MALSLWRGEMMPPPHNGDIAIGVVVISIATKVEVGVTDTIVVATKTAITVTVDIDPTTEERFANGRLSVPIGGLGEGRRMRCDMPSRRGARQWSSGAVIVWLVGCPQDSRVPSVCPMVSPAAS